MIPLAGALLVVAVKMAAHRCEGNFDRCKEDVLFTPNELIAFGQSKECMMPDGMMRPFESAIAAEMLGKKLEHLVDCGFLMRDRTGLKFYWTEILSSYSRAVVA